MAQQASPLQQISDYTNDVLQKALLKRENIPILEELLAAETEKLMRLQRVEGQGELDFGEVITDEDEMNALCRTLQREVEAYLGSPQLPDAMCCCYDDDGKPVDNPVYVGGSILITPMERMKAIPILAHELTHHILESRYPEHKAFLQTEGKAFNEGLARGVERKLSKVHAAREGNEALEYVSTGITVQDLGNMYRFLCHCLRKECKDELLEASNTYLNLTFGPSAWAIGTATYALREVERGEDIYREALRGNL